MKTLTSIILFLFFICCANAQPNENDLSKILKEIKKINEVEYRGVGITGQMGNNYKNYLILKHQASISQLVKLTNDANSVVACYAAWALIDTAYNNLPTIFNKFLSNDKYIRTYNGCLKGSDPLSSEFYHRYWNNARNQTGNKTLFTMDSLILYNDSTYWLLLLRALQNRVYPPTFNERISYWAFTRTNKDAITYLKNLNNKTYNEPIKQALISYFKNTNFSSAGITPYKETIDELLAYNDATLKPIIITKLKNDAFWKPFEKEFLEVLNKYGIQSADVK